MHEIEPFYNWRHIYVSEEDERSPFFGRDYSEFEFTQTIYNYYIHPQWDDFGSRTLYLKVLLADYDEHYVVMELFGEWVQKVLAGRYVAGAPLEDTDARLLTGKNEVLTDGPFLESKEMISGYFVINANDIEEATELTKQCPLLGQFRLEVRRLKPMG